MRHPLSMAHSSNTAMSRKRTVVEQRPLCNDGETIAIVRQPQSPCFHHPGPPRCGSLFGQLFSWCPSCSFAPGGVSQTYTVLPPFFHSVCVTQLKPTRPLRVPQSFPAWAHAAGNLAWKLASVLRGLCRPELLTSYFTERHAAIARNIALSQRNFRRVLEVTRVLGLDPSRASDENSAVGQSPNTDLAPTWSKTQPKKLKCEVDRRRILRVLGQTPSSQSDQSTGSNWID